MNRIVAGLEAAGLIERGPHPEFGRVLRASLTPRGRRLLAESHHRVQQAEAQMVAGLTPAERQQLADLLQRCARALRPPRPEKAAPPNPSADRQ
jgi:DNA-binding MarR family transcriptional regulator